MRRVSSWHSQFVSKIHWIDIRHVADEADVGTGMLGNVDIEEAWDSIRNRVLGITERF